MSKKLEDVMEEVVLVLNGLTDEVDSYELTPEQYEWFLVQAATVEKLQEDNKSHIQAFKNIKEQVKQCSDLDHYRGDHVITMEEFDAIMFEYEPISEEDGE